MYNYYDMRPILNPRDEDFNWLKALDFIITGNEPTEDEFDELNDAASGWPTCACGQLCKALPRGERGAPDDAELCDLGSSFADNIANKEWKWAKETFLAIEKRTYYLLTHPEKLVS